jgi:glycosyltransferase involved in cell wall biosynthesis
VIVNFDSNKDLLTRIKKNCLNSVKKYNWEKVSVEYVRLYKKIIKETFFK